MQLIKTITCRILFCVSISSIVLTTGCASDSDVKSQSAEMHQQLVPAIMKDPEVSGYLQAIGQRIVKAGADMSAQNKAPKAHYSEDSAWMYSGQMQFHLVNSKTLNAFTTGGEHMYIYNALFQKCRTEDELAAVMAHEYAHVYCRHIHGAMNRQKQQLAYILGGAAAGYALGGKEHRAEGALAGAGAGLVIGQFLGLKFTRDDESQADEYGMAFYWRSGWDPEKFGNFFQQLADAGLDTTPEMLSDHPSLKSRVEIAKQRAANLRGKIDSYRRPNIAEGQRFEALKNRAALLGRSLPSDSSLEAAQTLLSSFSSCVTPEDQPDQKQAQKTLEEAAKQQAQQQNQ